MTIETLKITKERLLSESKNREEIQVEQAKKDASEISQKDPEKKLFQELTKTAIAEITPLNLVPDKASRLLTDLFTGHFETKPHFVDLRFEKTELARAEIPINGYSSFTIVLVHLSRTYSEGKVLVYWYPHWV